MPSIDNGLSSQKKTAEKGVNSCGVSDCDMPMEVFIDTLTKFNQISNLYKNTETDEAENTLNPSSVLENISQKENVLRLKTI